MDRVKFQVITKIPDPNKGAGNLAAAICYGAEGGPPPVNPALVLLNFRTEVFTLGEIVVVNGDGREMVGRQRKASKWDVEYETFDDIEAAVRRAIVVTHEDGS